MSSLYTVYTAQYVHLKMLYMMCTLVIHLTSSSGTTSPNIVVTKIETQQCALNDWTHSVWSVETSGWITNFVFIECGKGTTVFQEKHCLNDSTFIWSCPVCNLYHLLAIHAVLQSTVSIDHLQVVQVSFGLRTCLASSCSCEELVIINCKSRLTCWPCYKWTGNIFTVITYT